MTVFFKKCYVKEAKNRLTFQNSTKCDAAVSESCRRFVFLVLLLLYIFDMVLAIFKLLPILKQHLLDYKAKKKEYKQIVLGMWLSTASGCCMKPCWVHRHLFNHLIFILVNTQFLIGPSSLTGTKILEWWSKQIFLNF